MDPATQDDKPETPDDYVLEGLRKDYPDMSDATDDDLFEAVRRADFSDTKDVNEYREALRRAYVPEAMRKPSAWQGLKNAASNVKQLGAKQVIKNVSHGLASAPAEMGKAIMGDVHAAGAGLGQSVAMGVDKMTGGGLEKPLNELESQSLQSLLARGYSPEVAQHVMKQRAETMGELAQGLQAEGAMGQENVGRGAAALGGAALAGVPGAALAEAGVGAAAARMGLNTPVFKAIGHTAKHMLEGAAGFGGYEGAKAAAEGKPAGEIYNRTLQGSGLGAGMSLVLGPVFARAGKTVATIGSIPRYVEEGVQAAAAKQVQALATQADVFAERFQGDWLRTRFSDLPILQAPDADPNMIAATIVSRVLGKDVAQNASEGAIAKLGDKIRTQRRFVGIDPSVEPPVHSEVDAIPAPEGLEPAQTFPGVAQMSQALGPPPPLTPRQALDAVIQAGEFNQQLESTKPFQGLPAEATPNGIEPNPQGEYRPNEAQPFTPPTGVQPVEGLQGVGAPAAAPEQPLALEGVAPQAPPAGLPSMTQPVVPAGAPAIEPRPAILPPAEPTAAPGAPVELPVPQQPGYGTIESPALRPPSPTAVAPAPGLAGSAVPAAGEAPQPHEFGPNMTPGLESTPTFTPPTGVKRPGGLEVPRMPAKALKEAAKAVGAGKGPDALTLISETADRNIEAAKTRMKKRGTRLNTFVDPADAADVAMIGANHIMKGAAKFTEWSAAMVQEFGETIRPHLEKLFRASKQAYEKLSSMGFFKRMQDERGFVSLGLKADAGDQVTKAMDYALRQFEPVKPRDVERATGALGGSYWLSPTGKLYHGPSHDTMAAAVTKAMKLKERAVGYKGDWRWENHAMLQQGFVRVQTGFGAVNAQLVREMTPAQRATLGELAKGKPLRGVITSHDGAEESELHTSLGDLLRAMETPTVKTDLDITKFEPIESGGYRAVFKHKNDFHEVTGTSAIDIRNKIEAFKEAQ
jgi:hypothetical protein